MLIKKVTTGWVTQVYDTEAKRFVSQEFQAGEQVDWESMNGAPVEAINEYLNFDMVQPPLPECEIDFITTENQEHFRNGIILDKIKLVRDIMQIFRPHNIPLNTATNFVNGSMVRVPRLVVHPLCELGIRMRIIG